MQDNSQIERKFPTIRVLYEKIAEPKNVRITLFTIYLCMGLAGFGLVLYAPDSVEYILGIISMYTFAGMVLVGAIFSGLAVLPGIWWLERVGLILLITGLGIYLIIVVALCGSYIRIAAATALGLCFVARWMDIRGAQLAPED